MLAVESLSFTYRRHQDRFAISNLNLKVAAGQVVGLTGMSGCGKTTLGNLLCGYLLPDDGRILVAGELIDRADYRVAMVFQEDALWPWLTLRQNVELGLHARGNGGMNASALDLLRSVDLEAAADQFPKHLSGGMKKRGEICRTLALNPRILILDEALKSLDFRNRRIIWSSIKGFISKNPNSLVINISHDLLDIAENCARCYVMSEGGAVEEVATLASDSLNQKVDKIRAAFTL